MKTCKKCEGYGRDKSARERVACQGIGIINDNGTLLTEEQKEEMYSRMWQHDFEYGGQEPPDDGVMIW